MTLHFGVQFRQCSTDYMDDPFDNQETREHVHWMEIPPAGSGFLRIRGKTRALLYRSEYGESYGGNKLKQLITADGGVLPYLASHLVQVSYLGSTDWTAEVLASALDIPSEDDDEANTYNVSEYDKEPFDIPLFASTAEYIRPICRSLLSRKRICYEHPVYLILKSVRQHYTDLLNTPWQKIANRSAQLSVDYRHCVSASEILALEPVLSKYTVLKQRPDFALGEENEEGFSASLHVQPRDKTIHPIKFDFGGHTTKVGGQFESQFGFQFFTGPETYPSGKKSNLLTRAGYAEAAAILGHMVAGCCEDCPSEQLTTDDGSNSSRNIHQQQQ
ncbi:hypothetical protein HDU89_003439 [Geranomyces variabilis]|nr:hypothetical protein HDU89_003439 [Geranomyces variabilis]